MTHLLPITRLTIQRYRSFEAATLDFQNPTVIVGRNGAGKSNLTDIFRFVSEAMESPLHAVIDRRGGYEELGYRKRQGGRAGNVGLAFEFGESGEMISGRYAFELKSLKGYRYEVAREQAVVNTRDGEHRWFDRATKWSSNVDGLKPALKSTSLALPLVGGDERFEPIFKCLGGIRTYAIEPSKLRDPQDPDGGETLLHDGSNAASVLRELSKPPGGERVRDRITEFLRQVAPEIVSVEHKKQGTKTTLEFHQTWDGGEALKFDAHSMSDGTLRSLGLILASLQQPSPSVLIVEEPEAAIHPGAIGALMDVLREASRSMQVVLTTHSPDLLDCAPDLDTNLRIISWAEGGSQVQLPDEATQEAIRSHLMGAGELLRANALRAEPLFLTAESVGSPRLFQELQL